MSSIIDSLYQCGEHDQDATLTSEVKAKIPRLGEEEKCKVRRTRQYRFEIFAMLTLVNISCSERSQYGIDLCNDICKVLCKAWRLLAGLMLEQISGNCFPLAVHS